MLETDCLTEMRFWVFIPFIPFQIAGAWWFGYALDLGQSWVAVAVAYAMANFGQAPISAIALTYMTDSYNEVRPVPNSTISSGHDKVP